MTPGLVPSKCLYAITSPSAVFIRSLAACVIGLREKLIRRGKASDNLFLGKTPQGWDV